MKYQIASWKISELIEHLKSDHIDLSPSYQRNFIWSPNDQKSLIDSILVGYPLPSIFLYKKNSSSYEMVDGQQRSRTILKFWNGLLSDSNKNSIENISKDLFLNYKLNIIIISDLEKKDSLENFYTLVNKSGKHLNKPELFKAQFHNKLLLTLVEEITNLQDLINLNLFSDATVKRMNDRAFVEELVAYLKFGITDKKDAVERMYQNDIPQDEYDRLMSLFNTLIKKIIILDEFEKINVTRYKQKNDFYTLFCFVNENQYLTENMLIQQYKLLLSIQRFITPSNDDCEPFKAYAINCVSQSNSKKARLNRLKFFNELLLNKNEGGNLTINTIMDFFDEIADNIVKLNQFEEYYLLNSEEISKL